MARVRKSPSHYPMIPNMIIRFVQGFSAVAVASIMIYFVWHINHGQHYDIPKTFILLLVTGILTESFLIGTSIVSCFMNISPVIYMLAHALILVLWTVGAVLLGVYASHTLTNACDLRNWGKDGAGGRHICRTYKILFAFTFLAWFSTLCALYLDIRVRRKQTHRGTYAKMQDLDHKRDMPYDDPWSTDVHERHSEQHSEYIPANGARGGYGHVGESHAPAAEYQPLHSSFSPELQSTNAAPLDFHEHQPVHAFTTSDTGYHGHSSELFYGNDTRR